MTKVAYVLVIIGGLNWGFEALNFNLVNILLGTWTTAEKIVYILVGLSALWLIVDKFKGKKQISNSSSTI